MQGVVCIQVQSKCQISKTSCGGVFDFQKWPVNQNSFGKPQNRWNLETKIKASTLHFKEKEKGGLDFESLDFAQLL